MNREIKFRAWYRGCMQYNVYISADYVFEQLPDRDGGWHGFYADVDDVELMQFTGLYDKKGNEIYEGDIVVDHAGRGIVKFNDGYAGFRVNYKDGDYTLNGESIVIVGNMFEHQL